MTKTTSPRETPQVADRDYLTPAEANRLIAACGKIGRNSLRDQTLVRLMFRHGLRATEARYVKWTHFALDEGEGPKTFLVRRIKDGIDSKHTLDRDEVAALRKLRAGADSQQVFVSERGGVLSADMIARIVKRAAIAAGIEFHVHPHMLRHSAGHMLADAGHDTRRIQAFLGHRDIRNTVRYTALSPQALRDVRVR